VSVTSNWEYADEVDFSEVYVASPTDTAAKINAKLAEGLHLVLQPGIYRLEESIKLNKSHYVVLGLGMATLIPMNGTPAIEVGDVYDVRIAGVILEAGVKPSETLLKFSDKGYEGSSDYPSSLNDVTHALAGTTPHQMSTCAPLSFWKSIQVMLSWIIFGFQGPTETTTVRSKTVKIRF